MVTENSYSTSINENNLDTTPCPMSNCIADGTLTIQCAHYGDKYHYLGLGLKEKDTDGLEYHCPRYQKRQVRCDSAQCIREGLYRVSYNDCPKSLVAPFPAKQCSHKQLTEEVNSQYQKPSKEAEIFILHKLLLLQRL
ncbi:hypothetical protein PR048_017251 [Dryococelus australis]|uniref:Uncharacterized protein n=1 Tax=Dryococelus australis TaxID=614101 RepID=A0ABQ9H974_9NEOP|nr:hypothetical protein PR048_017251 [Dryococelus australis]